MLRKFILAGVFAFFGLIAMLFAHEAAMAKLQDKKDEKLPSIDEIMNKGHEGPQAHLTKLREAAKADKWDAAKEHAKVLAFYGESLGKNKPPKGDDASWKALSAKYAASTKALLKATEDKDIKGIAKALGTINCGDCHKIHKVE